MRRRAARPRLGSTWVVETGSTPSPADPGPQPCPESPRCWGRSRESSAGDGPGWPRRSGAGALAGAGLGGATGPSTGRGAGAVRRRSEVGLEAMLPRSGLRGER